jgi:dTDP-4-amino-4,6-dideoxygalactose transaminase
VEYGYKFHMNDVCATIGLQQLNHVGDILDRHRSNAAYYDEQLKDLAGVKLLAYQPNRLSSYWLYTVLVEDRLDFMRQMQDAKITVSQVHARNDKHTMMRDFVTDLPGVDAFVDKQVSIPVGWWLSDEDRAYIAEKIHSIRG